MATYIQGVTDYIPKFQPFQPDLNFYNTVLQTKEAQYMAGYDKISSLYGTLLNSQMLREPDIKKRDQYFKDIHQEIQKLSMVDLSMPQNVSQARKIFQPLLDDKNIVSDMALTKKWNAEKQKAESLRNCVDTDKKKCTGWWQDGWDNLSYWADDYSKTTDEEALKYDWTPRYVPYVDVGDQFQKLMKDMNFKVTDTGFTKDGRFLVEQTNGSLMSLSLTKFLTGTLGSDPAVADMYRVRAENARHMWVRTNADKYNGDYGLAEDAYYDMVRGELDKLKEDKQLIEKSKNTVNSKIAVVKRKIDQSPNGISEESQLYKTLSLLLQEQVVTDTASSQANDAITSVERAGMFTEDRMARRKQLDYSLGYMAMQNSMADLAATYSNLTSETKYKVNEYKLAAEKHSYDLSLAKYKNMLDMGRDYQKHLYDLEKQEKKAKLNGEQVPSTIPNTYTPNLSAEALKGGATAQEDVLNTQLTDILDLASQKTGYQGNAVKQFYNDLANAADYESDPVKKKYAINQLNQIFGTEKGSDGTYSTRQLKNPDRYYDQVVGLTKDPVYNSTFPGFSNKIYKDIQNVNIENQAIAAYNKTTEKNIANLFNYLQTVSGTIKGTSKDDIIKMKAVIDEKYGITRKTEEIQKRLAQSGIYVDLDEAEEIKFKYKQLFRDHYSAGYTVGKGTPIVKPYDWHPGMPVNTGGTAAYPTTASVGNSYKTMNQATLDALAMSNWMQTNKSSDNYMLYRGIGVTGEEEGIKPEDGGVETDLIQYALNALSKEVPLNKSQGKLTEGMRVTLHPIIMNDKSKRGFSLSIPEPVFNKWKKDQGKTAASTAKYSDFSDFTLVMPEDKAPDDLFGRFNPKPIKAIIRNGGTVKITHPLGGDIKLYGNNDGSVGISGIVKYYQGKNLVDMNANEMGINPFMDPDYLYNILSSEIQKQGERNFELMNSPNNPANAGNIKSGDQAEEYIRSMIMGQNQGQ